MIEVGILKNFDSGVYKASVQLAGSLTTYFDDINVAKNIPSSALVVGNYVIVAIPNGNPKDACIIATWPQGSPGGGAGSFLDLSDTPSSYSGQAGKVPRVNSAENALEFVRFLLAPAGTDWKNRTYEGWEVVDTSTTYTVGSGQDFATLAAAAASLQKLILAAVVTVQLEEDITLTSQVLFQNMISKAAGRLQIDLNGHDITVNHNGYGLYFFGPFEAWLLDTSGSPYGSIKAGASAGGSTYLVRWRGANGITKWIDFDANSKAIAAMITATNTAQVYLHSGTSFSDTGGAGSYSHAVQATMQSWVSSNVIAGVGADDFEIVNGAMAIDRDGHIHTEAGEFTP